MTDVAADAVDDRFLWSADDLVVVSPTPAEFGGPGSGPKPGHRSSWYERGSKAKVENAVRDYQLASTEDFALWRESSARVAAGEADPGNSRDEMAEMLMAEASEGNPTKAPLFRGMVFEGASLDQVKTMFSVPSLDVPLASFTTNERTAGSSFAAVDPATLEWGTSVVMVLEPGARSFDTSGVESSGVHDEAEHLVTGRLKVKNVETRNVSYYDDVEPIPVVFVTVEQDGVFLNADGES